MYQSSSILTSGYIWFIFNYYYLFIIYVYLFTNTRYAKNMVNVPLRVNVETKRWKRPLEIWTPLFAGACLTLALLTSAPSISVFLGEKMLYLLSRRAWRCYHWSPLNNASNRHIYMHIGDTYVSVRDTHERGGNRWMFIDMSLFLLCKISVCVCTCHSSRILLQCPWISIY